MSYSGTGYHIFLRMWKKLYYRPIHLVFSFIQPIFWLTIFGYLFGNKFDFDQGSYLSYLLPGVCAMTVLQSSAQSGIQFIKDLKSGFFGRYHYTSIPKSLFLIYKILADYSRIMVQILLIIFIGVLIGVGHVAIVGDGILVIALGTVLFTFFYASISCLIALKTKQSEMLASFIHLFNLPIIFTSTALIPNKNLPIWLEKFAAYNPLSHLSEILRDRMLDIQYVNAVHGNSFLLLVLLSTLSFLSVNWYLKKLRYV